MAWMLQHGKKLIRITAGIGVILIGMGLGFVPGIPGFPLVFLGLGLLAMDFVWARRLKKRIEAQTRKMVDKVRDQL
jgi:flagellar biosynthesis component FlhA